MNNDTSPQRQRETLLTIFLTVFFAGGFLLFLILVSGGFFLYVVLGMAAICFLALCHYLLWGWAFSRQVAGEREEEELREQAETEGWPVPGSRPPPHY